MKLICLGDSTMQYNDASTYPQVGWPQALYRYLNDGVLLLNFAKNGRSTRTFLEYGHFDEAMKHIDERSVVLIEFGHNDGHTQDPERFTRPDYEYRDNLIYMIGKIREKGGMPVLLTPIFRRHFLPDGRLDDACHAGYHEAMRKVAEDTDTPVIDMTLLTKDLLYKLGEEKSKELFMNFPAGVYPNYPEGLNDNTHLRMKGARMIAKIFVKEAVKMELFREVLHD